MSVKPFVIFAPATSSTFFWHRAIQQSGDVGTGEAVQPLALRHRSRLHQASGATSFGRNTSGSGRSWKDWSIPATAQKNTTIFKTMEERESAGFVMAANRRPADE